MNLCSMLALVCVVLCLWPATAHIAQDGSVESIIRRSYQQLQFDRTNSSRSDCACVHYNCGCCEHVDIEKIKLNSTVCANVSYLPTEYGINLSLTVNGRRVINVTVSAKNPPPLCIGIPHLKDAASVCIDFYNLDIANGTFSGCIKLQFRLAFVVIESVDLGCFRMPIGRRSPLDLIELVNVSRMLTKKSSRNS